MGERERAGRSHLVGRVLRAHGLRGDVHVQLFRPRRLLGVRHETRQAIAERSVLLQRSSGGMEARPVRLARFIDPMRVVLHLGGVDDRIGAEALAGALVFVDPLDPPEVFTDEADRLVGARAVDEDGSELGIVRAVDDNGAQALLEIQGARKFLVPFVEAFIAGIRLEGEDREVRVRVLPGLFDLDTE